MELETHLILSRSLQYLNPAELDSILGPVKDVEKMLNRLISVLKSPKGKPPTTVGNPVSRVPVSRLPVSRVPVSRIPATRGQGWTGRS